MSILEIIFIISFLVLIHELGHFIIAKISKVKVEEFGLGYPPKLFKLFNWRGTDFTFNAIPFGGFVRLQGELGPDDEEKKVGKDNIVVSKSGEGPFYSKRTRDKVAVIIAGPIMNYLIGLIAFSIIFIIIGVPKDIEGARITSVIPDSPAEKAGIELDREVVFLQHQDKTTPIYEYNDIVNFTKDHRGETIKIVTKGPCVNDVCQEDIKEYDVYIRTAEETPAGKGAMGVVFTTSYSYLSPSVSERIGLAFISASQETVFVVQETLSALKNFFLKLFLKGEIVENIAGPIGIVHQAHQIDLASEGILGFLSVTAMISVNLVVINLLPIPALDGGRAIFIVLQRFAKRAKLEKIESIMNTSGLVILLILMVVVTYKDIVRLIQG